MKKINIKEIEKLMTVSTTYFKTIPADIALWLYYRRLDKRPVRAGVLVGLNIGVSYSMIDTFFSKKKGIQSLKAKDLSFEGIFKHFKQPYPGDKIVEGMIENCEKKYGHLVDLEMKKKKEMRKKRTVKKK